MATARYKVVNGKTHRRGVKLEATRKSGYRIREPGVVARYVKEVMGSLLAIYMI